VRYSVLIMARKADQTARREQLAEAAQHAIAEYGSAIRD
jgi:hypothetical protein